MSSHVVLCYVMLCADFLRVFVPACSDYHWGLAAEVLQGLTNQQRLERSSKLRLPKAPQINSERKEKTRNIDKLNGLVRLVPLFTFTFRLGEADLNACECENLL